MLNIKHRTQAHTMDVAFAGHNLLNVVMGHGRSQNASRQVYGRHINNPELGHKHKAQNLEKQWGKWSNDGLVKELHQFKLRFERGGKQEALTIKGRRKRLFRL